MTGAFPLPLSDQQVFVRYLRFVAANTPRDTPEISAVMAALDKVADDLEAEGWFSVPATSLQPAARGIAGLAGFLQQQILPEAVADKNAEAERQVRWVIDTAMALVSDLTMYAELGEADPEHRFTLRE